MRGIANNTAMVRNAPSSKLTTVNHGSPVQKPVQQDTPKVTEPQPKPLSQQARTQKKNEQQLSGKANQAKLQNDVEGKYAKKQTWDKTGHGQFEKKQTWEKTGTKSEAESGVQGKTKSREQEYANEKTKADFLNKGNNTGIDKAATDRGGVVKTHYNETPEQQAKTKLNVKDGLIYGADGKPLDTKGAKPGFSADGNIKENRMIYTMNPDKTMHAADFTKENKQFKKEYDQGTGVDKERFHHTTFNGGKDVAAAGEIDVRNGRPVAISNISGHYKPSVETGVQTLQEMKKQGVNVDHVKYDMVYKTGKKTDTGEDEVKRTTRYGTEVMQAHGNTKNINAKLDTLDELKRMKLNADEQNLKGSDSSKLQSNLRPSDVKSHMQVQKEEQKQAQQQSANQPSTQQVKGYYGDQKLAEAEQKNQKVGYYPDLNKTTAPDNHVASSYIPAPPPPPAMKPVQQQVENEPVIKGSYFEFK